MFRNMIVKFLTNIRFHRKSKQQVCWFIFVENYSFSERNCLICLGFEKPRAMAALTKNRRTGLWVLNSLVLLLLSHCRAQQFVKTLVNNLNQYETKKKHILSLSCHVYPTPSKPAQGAFLFIHPNINPCFSFFCLSIIQFSPTTGCALQITRPLEKRRITLEERKSQFDWQREGGKSQSGLQWRSGIKEPAVICDVTSPIQHTRLSLSTREDHDWHNLWNQHWM